MADSTIGAIHISQAYPLHFAVFENNVTLLSELLAQPQNTEPEKINALDMHGNSPVMLATLLARVECAELLLKHGADANSQNKDMWSLSHEAVSLGNPDYLKSVLNYRDYQRAVQTSTILLELRQSLKDSKDFYVEMAWEFTSSWLRFVKNMCPSDTYKIYKHGSNIRIDSTLLDFESKYNWKRGNQSFIFRFTDAENAEIISVDYEQKVAYVQIINLNSRPQLSDFTPSDYVVSEKLLAPITTTYVDVDNIGFERSKSSGLFSWIGSSEKEEDVEGYTCRVFNASNVEIITKTRVEHLSEEDRTKHLKNDNRPMSFVMGFFEKKKSDNSKDDWSENAESSDPTCGFTADQYLSSSQNDTIIIGRRRREVTRSNSFGATLCLAETFPLNLHEQIFPVIDLMSVRNAKFSRLKSFIQLQLPSGFPVRISIPLFHMINAQVTFKKVNEPPVGLSTNEAEIDELSGLPVFQLDPALFEIPKDFQVLAVSNPLANPQIPEEENETVDDDFVKALEISRQEEQRRKEDEEREEEELRKMNQKDSTGRVVYRNEPGTKREEWCKWNKVIAFDEMDSTLNVQQWIQQCILIDFKNIDHILNCPKGVEEGVWKYEHLRQFCMELNGLAELLQEVSHRNPKECSAIDYTRHTLDGAASLLNSNRYFASRISIKESSIAKIGSVCRRVYRIFSHAYFHHRTVFDAFESETFLCKRFTSFVIKYQLMAQEHLIVPILEQPEHNNSA
ncbi:hypothetical protein Ddc_07835 [Ditylenchus destructor]|nr:hypothetical protein Ddc_07835 [Ditylenchus destructor]